MFPYSTPKRILLIEPPFYRFFKYQRWHYPITLTLVATHLDKLGHHVRIYDADAPTPDCRPLSRSEVRNNYPMFSEALKNEGHPIWQEVKDHIVEFKPDIVGFTSITPKIDSTNKIAHFVKEKFNGKVKTILGGPHAYAMKSMYPDYDFGNLYDDVVTHIPNLVDQRPRKDLIIDSSQYSPRNLSTILTTAGCPMQCTFCGRSYDRTFVYRNIDSIKEELEEIAAYDGPPPLYIVDDCFFSHTKRFYEICDVIKPFGLKFSAGGRMMALDKHKLNYFLDSGGEKVLVGVESGSQKILDRIKKKLKIEEIIKRTKWINELGIPWSAFIIVGLPFETLDDLKKTEELIYKIQPTFASINRFTPYPGTEIFKEFYFDLDLSLRDLFQLNSNVPTHLSQEIEDYIDHMFESFDKYNAKKKLKAPNRQS